MSISSESAGTPVSRIQVSTQARHQL